jgi:hypothetical protein
MVLWEAGVQVLWDRWRNGTDGVMGCWALWHEWCSGTDCGRWSSMQRYMHAHLLVQDGVLGGSGATLSLRKQMAGLSATAGWKVACACSADAGVA